MHDTTSEPRRCQCAIASMMSSKTIVSQVTRTLPIAISQAATPHFGAWPLRVSERSIDGPMMSTATL